MHGLGVILVSHWTMGKGKKWTKEFGGRGQCVNAPVGKKNPGRHLGHRWGKQTGLLHSGLKTRCQRAGLRCAGRPREGSGAQASWPQTIPRVRWGAEAGGGYLGEGSVPRANLPFITKGLPFVGQSPLRNPHQKHKVSEIFLGLASWCDPQNSVGGQWEKTPSFPPVVPGPAVLSLKYLTSSWDTKMDLAKASPVRSSKNKHTTYSAVTVPYKEPACACAEGNTA